MQTNHLPIYFEVMPIIYFSDNIVNTPHIQCNPPPTHLRELKHAPFLPPTRRESSRATRWLRREGARPSSTGEFLLSLCVGLTQAILVSRQLSPSLLSGPCIHGGGGHGGFAIGNP